MLGILFLFVYFTSTIICITRGCLTPQPAAMGMIIGITKGMRIGFFPRPIPSGRKKGNALLFRRERTSCVSMSVYLCVCLKSKYSICVSEYWVTRQDAPQEMGRN